MECSGKALPEVGVKNIQKGGVVKQSVTLWCVDGCSVGLCGKG